MKEIKIGTRNSPLAIWQAREVARFLQNQNRKTEIIPVISDEENSHENYSDEDKELFTKDLDIALQNKEIDIAVHSLKDLPSQLPENIEIIAYLKRDFAHDVLVRNDFSKNKPLHELKIATNDDRRKVFWKKQFPFSEFVEIPGNANTRLEKVTKNEADATIISFARLKRLNLNLNFEELPFMISAPSQGVVAALGRTDNQELNSLLIALNDEETQYVSENERGFQKVFSEKKDFQVGAFAEIQDNKIRFKGIACSQDGKKYFETDNIFPVDFTKNYGEEVGRQILGNLGGEF